MDEEEGGTEKNNKRKKEESIEEVSESEVEEMNQTEIKDYNNKEEVFPGHWWEPRVTEEDITRTLKHTPVPYVEAINMDNRHQRFKDGATDTYMKCMNQ